MLALQTARKQQKSAVAAAGKRQIMIKDLQARTGQNKNIYYNSQLKKKLPL